MCVCQSKLQCVCVFVLFVMKEHVNQLTKWLIEVFFIVFWATVELYCREEGDTSCVCRSKTFRVDFCLFIGLLTTRKKKEKLLMCSSESVPPSGEKGKQVTAVLLKL